MLGVEDYILNRPTKQKQIMMHLHLLFSSYPSITSKLSFKIPMYYQNTWVCFLNPLKNKSIELVFLKGVEMNNPHLKVKGRKLVAGMEIESLESMNEELILTIFEEALKLDANVNKRSKRKSK